MAVSDRYITSSLWDSVRDLLVAAAPYVTISAVSTDTVTATITGSYNDKTMSRPTIVINPIPMDEGEWKFGSNEGRKFLNVTIDCYDKRTSGIDELYDQVQYALKNTEISGVQLIAVSSDVGFYSVNDNKYHVKTGTFTYDRG